MNKMENVESTLLMNLFYYENGISTPNEEFSSAKRRKAIALLDEDREELEEIDQDLANEYGETITYLESISDEEYLSLKTKLQSQIEVTEGA
ncbi:transcriptional regulator [Streptococcus gallolyticus]|nr:transcriptional regulator [Streptococcus gallolyticus]MBY5041795.1 transcriptional regulator [Streptococcus gallolyticus]